MTVVPAPSDANWLRHELAALKRRIDALERPETLVVIDPNHQVGDPAHGWAIFIRGNLTPITGLTSGGSALYGAASFKTGSWVVL